jgi:hypothetical protein
LAELLDVSRTGLESFHVAHKAVVAVWESLVITSVFFSLNGGNCFSMHSNPPHSRIGLSVLRARLRHTGVASHDTGSARRQKFEWSIRGWATFRASGTAPQRKTYLAPCITRKTLRLLRLSGVVIFTRWAGCCL